MFHEKEKCAKYMVVCINAFAASKGIDRQAAFRYLYNQGGIRFLMEHYDIEHTLSFHEVLEDLTLVCQKNGGHIL